MKAGVRKAIEAAHAPKVVEVQVELKPKPKRARPNFSGVPGALVSAAEVGGLQFTQRKLMSSPYDPLLKQLAEAGPGQVLRFEDLRARNSVKVRAKKLGLRVSFAESASGRALYVRLDGRVDDDIRGSRRAGIKDALKFGPRGTMELVNVLRDKGDTTIDLSTMEAILGQMRRAGDVVQQEGGKWTRSPLAKAVGA